MEAIFKVKWLLLLFFFFFFFYSSSSYDYHYCYHRYYYYSMKHQLTWSDYFMIYWLLVAFSSHARQKRNMQDLKCQNGTLSNGVSKSPSEPILTAATNGPTKIVNEGNDPTFHCIVHSSLPANITWFYNGKPLMNDSLHRYFQCNTVLQLRRVSSKDAGNYSCVVNSALGKATASSRLSVIRK